MATYLTTTEDLTTVANAIRAKGGTSAQLSFPSGMATAIANIQTGITPSGTLSITANGTHDVTSYASANVNVPTPNVKVFQVTLASDLSSGTLLSADATLLAHRADANARLYIKVSPYSSSTSSGYSFWGGNLDISFAQDGSCYSYVGRRSSTSNGQVAIAKKISDTSGTGCYILADGSVKWNITSSVIRSGSTVDIVFVW